LGHRGGFSSFREKEEKGRAMEASLPFSGKIEKIRGPEL